MKSLKFVLLGAVVATFVACGDKEPEIPAEDVVGQGMKNLYAVESGSYNVSFDGELMIPAGDGTTQNTALKLEIGGEYNESDPENRQMSMKIGFSGALNGEDNESAKAELRLLGNKIYASLSELSDFGGQLPQEMLQAFLNQWWYIEVPAESLAQNDERYQDLLGNTMLFKDLAYIDNEDVKGLDSYHYRGTLDKAALSSYFADVAELEGQNLELVSYQTYLEGIEFEGELWVSADDMIVDRLKGNLVVNDSIGSGAGAEMEMDMIFWDFNKDVKIEEPVNATFFDLAALFGGLGASVADETAIDYGDEAVIDDIVVEDEVVVE